MDQLYLEHLNLEVIRFLDQTDLLMDQFHRLNLISLVKFSANGFWLFALIHVYLLILVGPMSYEISNIRINQKRFPRRCKRNHKHRRIEQISLHISRWNLSFQVVDIYNLLIHDHLSLLELISQYLKCYLGFKESCHSWEKRFAHLVPFYSSLYRHDSFH